MSKETNKDYQALLWAAGSWELHAVQQEPREVIVHANLELERMIRERLAYVIGQEILTRSSDSDGFSVEEPTTATNNNYEFRFDVCVIPKDKLFSMLDRAFDIGRKEGVNEGLITLENIKQELRM